MLLTETHCFKCTISQKETLKRLKYVYKIDTSEYIRMAIAEKLAKDKINIRKEYQNKDCPF